MRKLYGDVSPARDHDMLWQFSNIEYFIGRDRVLDTRQLI